MSRKSASIPVIQPGGESAKETAPYFLPIWNCLPVRNSKPDEAMKLGGKTGRSQPVPLELERHLLVHVENGVQLGQPGFAVQYLGGHAQPLEVVENVGLDARSDGA